MIRRGVNCAALISIAFIVLLVFSRQRYSLPLLPTALSQLWVAKSDGRYRAADKLETILTVLRSRMRIPRSKTTPFEQKDAKNAKCFHPAWRALRPSVCYSDRRI